MTAVTTLPPPSRQRHPLLKLLVFGAIAGTAGAFVKQLAEKKLGIKHPDAPLKGPLLKGAALGAVYAMWKD